MQFGAARLLHSGAMFIPQIRIATRESEFNPRPRGPRGTQYLAVDTSRVRAPARVDESRAAKALEKSDTSNLDSARQRAQSTRAINSAYRNDVGSVSLCIPRS